MGWLTVSVLLAFGAAAGQPTPQPPGNREQQVESLSGSPLLDSDQSSVFMKFEKVGKCPPASGPSDLLVWLALKNNTRWPIVVLANGVENECYGEAIPFYRVEVDESVLPSGPIPHGHWFDVASALEIEPGGVLTFSVPRDRLDPGLVVSVDFQFAWERNNRHTRHSSRFSYRDLPSNLRDKEKEKRLKYRFEIRLHGGPAEYHSSPVPTVLLPPEPLLRPPEQ